MWISRREYNMLTSQANYWREKYEEERLRADTLTNNLLMTNGLPPADVRKPRDDDHPSSRKAPTEMLSELFEMEITDRLEDSAVEDIPVDTPTT